MPSRRTWAGALVVAAALLGPTTIAAAADDPAAPASTPAAPAVTQLDGRYPQQVTTQPTDQHILPGGEAQFKITYSGAWSRIQWQHQALGSPDWVPIEGARSEVYRVAATESAAGSYRAALTSRYGIVTSSPVVLVLAKRPNVVREPDNSHGLVGETIEYTSSAEGIPAPAVQWEKKLPDGEWEAVPGATNEKLSFTIEEEDNRAQYRAVFTNSVGLDKSLPAGLQAIVPVASRRAPYDGGMWAAARVPLTVLGAGLLLGGATYAAVNMFGRGGSGGGSRNGLFKERSGA